MTDSEFLENKKIARIHYTAAFNGGFLGLYPVLSAVHLFGSAQTSNLIEIVLTVLKGNWGGMALHLCGAFLYGLAVFIVTVLKGQTKLNVKVISMTVNIFAAIVMFVLPEGLPLVVYMYPTFFAMSFQWCSFPGAYGYVSSTIFSTNNLRQMVNGFTEAYVNKKSEFKLKGVFFGSVILFFHLGVICSYFLYMYFNKAGFLFVSIPAFLNILLILRYEKTV